MTCKISLCKALRELLKHHLASVFTVCLIFFIKTIAFFLDVQSYATGDYISRSDKEYVFERLQDMTLPGYGVAFLTGCMGIFLAFEPVATITSSAPRAFISLTSVFILTSMGSFATSRIYHEIRSRSFSLNEGAAAAMNTPFLCRPFWP